MKPGIMRARRLTTALLLLAGAGPAATTTLGSRDAQARSSLAAAGSSGNVIVSWEPLEPTQGTLITLVAEASREVPGPPARIEGSVAGEPLHFSAGEEGRYRALAAVPMDSLPYISATVRVEWDDGLSAAAIARIPVSRGEYRLERLTVAPRYAEPPDEALAARIAREREKARAVSRAAHSTPRLWAEPFLLPRDSRVTSGFGHGREFNGAVQSRHMGLDLAGAPGAPVRAANRGVVALVGEFYYAGNAVYLDHGEGLVTGYFHLSRVDVVVGDTVGRAHVIGSVGATGRVTGPHLHWIARYGQTTVNPLGLLDLQIPPSRASAGDP